MKIKEVVIGEVKTAPARPIQSSKTPHTGKAPKHSYLKIKGILFRVISQNRRFYRIIEASVLPTQERAYDTGMVNKNIVNLVENLSDEDKDSLPLIKYPLGTVIFRVVGDTRTHFICENVQTDTGFPIRIPKKEPVVTV